MPETVTNRLDVVDADGNIKVSLTDAGELIAGGAGAAGDLVLRGSENQTRVRLRAAGQAQFGGDGSAGKIALLRAGDNNSGTADGAIELHGATGNIVSTGDLILRSTAQGKDRITLENDNATARLGGNGAGGRLNLYAASAEHGSPSEAVISLNAQEGTIKAGGQGEAGQLTLRSEGDKLRMHFLATGGLIFLRDENGADQFRLSGDDGDLLLGGNGVRGDLLLFSPTKRLTNEQDATMRLTGGGAAYFGGNGGDADLALFARGGDNRTADEAVIRLNADSGVVKVKGSFRYVDGALRLGSGGHDGTLILRNGGGDETVRVDGGGGEIKVKGSLLYADGTLSLGSGGRDGMLLLRNAAGVETVRMDGQAGDVILGNADCAEDFDLAEGEECVPGAVMVFGEDGSLRLSACEYDTAVAGVVSGAGSYRPGIVLDRRAVAGPGRRAPLAMLGKVFCLVDADFGAVRPGALLTTSPRRGHAMRASDPARAFGAVIGKALKPLESGQALVPVMVSLQ